ncbi:MAG TPA: hypothetical protein VIK89_15825 [Cytophagaceae bacterium]
MKKYLFSLFLILSLGLAQAQSDEEMALTDTLASYGKVYVLVAETTQNIPDTIKLFNKDFVLVSQPRKTEDNKTIYIVSEPKNAYAQSIRINDNIYEATSTAAMADRLRADGKIYVVVLVLLMILAGFIFYVIRVEKKLNKLQNQ